MYICYKIMNAFCIIPRFFLVDLRDAKEVRFGRKSKEFDRWPDELKKFEATKCFVLLYGNEFKLKTLSVVGM